MNKINMCYTIINDHHYLVPADLSVNFCVAEKTLEEAYKEVSKELLKIYNEAYKPSISISDSQELLYEFGKFKRNKKESFISMIIPWERTCKKV